MRYKQAFVYNVVYDMLNTRINQKTNPISIFNKDLLHCSPDDFRYLSITTKSDRALNQLYKDWYPLKDVLTRFTGLSKFKYVKSLPDMKYLEANLTPLSLTMWLMFAGEFVLDKKSGFYICKEPVVYGVFYLGGFIDLDSLFILRKVLYKLFQVKAHIVYPVYSDQPTLEIRDADALLFYKLVSSHVHPFCCANII